MSSVHSNNPIFTPPYLSFNACSVTSIIESPPDSHGECYLVYPRAFFFQLLFANTILAAFTSCEIQYMDFYRPL